MIISFDFSFDFFLSDVNLLQRGVTVREQSDL